MLRKMKWLVATPKRSVVIGILTVALASSVSWAAWTLLTGSATSNGQFGSLSVALAAPTTYPTSTCWPNGTCDGVIKLDNTSGSPLKITGWTGTAAVGDPWDAASTISGTGCTLSLLQSASTGLKILAKSGQSIAVPVGNTAITIPGLYTSGDLNPLCQGKTFSLIPSSGGFALTIGP